MKKSSFLLVYGSETGQAKAIAEQIAEKSADLGLYPNFHCLDETSKEFNIEEETCMVMVTSTTGDGDAPANASKFLRRIKKRTLASDYLSHLHYTILGLGDTNYNHFCKCARDIDSRLEQLGAKRFYPTGLADDGVGLEIVADPWLEGVYPALKKFLGGQENSDTLLSERVEAAADTKDCVNKLSVKTMQVQLNGNHKIDAGDDCADSVILKDREKKDAPFDSDSGGKEILVFEKGMKSDMEEILRTKDSVSPDVYQYSRKCDKTQTLCERIDVASITDPDVKLRLSDCSVLLENRDLTIPVLGPDFLKADYFDKVLDTVDLSFQNGCKLLSSASDILHAQVSHAEVLTQPGSVKKTLWLRLQVKEHEMKYSPGDSISVLCANNPSEVELLLERLGATHLADKQLTLSLIPNTKKRRAAVPPHIHPVTTLRHVLTSCISIRDPPSKALIRSLIEHTKDEKEIRRLQELCSKEGVEEYTKCIREPSVSILDILYAFPTCHPPIERLIEYMPRLLPRPYSVCSCPENNPDCLDIVFNVVDIPGNIKDGRYYHRRGVCTGWLDDITTSLQISCGGDKTESGNNNTSEDIKIAMFFRCNQHFRPPSDISKPLILIGPGTGVSPFIGFLQQRALLKSKGEKEDKYGETWLFSGFRNREKDFLFKKDLEGFAESGTLTRLCISFSRDPDSTHRYVQDYMRAESASLARLMIEEEAMVYVCGDARNMAKDVLAAFQEILAAQKGFSADEASSFIMKKRLHKSYLEDVWT